MSKRTRKTITKILMTGAGFFINECLDEYALVAKAIEKELERQGINTKRSQEVGKSSEPNPNPNPLSCSPCSECLIKIGAISRLLDEREIPHYDDDGRELDTYDRIAILAAASALEEELN